MGAHPVWGVFLLALAIRVGVAVAIALVHPQNIAPDGIEYSALAAAKASGHTAGWGPYQHFLYHVTLTLLLPLTWLYKVFGEHQLIAQLFVALFGAGTAAVATRLGMEALPKRWALAVGLIVALLPTQIVWSSLILKDAVVWLLLAGLALTVAVAGRSRGRRLVALGLTAAGMLVLLGYTREYTLIIAAWAMMLAVLVGPRTHRLPQIAGAVVMAVLIPWAVFGMGPAGLTYIGSSPAPSDIRAGMAVGASSAVPGVSTTAATSQSEVGTDVSYIPQGVVVMLAEPFPWQVTGSTYLKLARAEAIIWYPLLLLALVGLLSLRTRQLRVMAFPVLAGGATLLSYALVEGNLGTAFRHRGELEWVVALLAGFGLWRLARWRAQRRDVSDATGSGPSAREIGANHAAEQPITNRNPEPTPSHR
ncbi:MAG TPA: hypothetical protein VFH80_05370 [Solirubrobacteraceae bacterium]|nr:hypothetical protein [Solirubrobacteraceae bacterium]